MAVAWRLEGLAALTRRPHGSLASQRRSVPLVRELGDLSHLSPAGERLTRRPHVVRELGDLPHLSPAGELLRICPYGSSY